MHYITSHYITLHYITLHYITLRYVTLHIYIYIPPLAIYRLPGRIPPRLLQEDASIQASIVSLLFHEAESVVVSSRFSSQRSPENGDLHGGIDDLYLYIYNIYIYVYHWYPIIPKIYLDPMNIPVIMYIYICIYTIDILLCSMNIIFQS